MLDMRERVWNGILNTDRMIRYFSALGRKNRTIHSWMVRGTVIGASGAMASLLAQFPEAVAVVVLFAVSVATIWSSLEDYSGKAAMAAAIANQYEDLAVEWQNLWYGNITPEVVNALELRYNKIASGWPLDEDTNLNQKAQEETYETIPMAYRVS